MAATAFVYVDDSGTPQIDPATLMDMAVNLALATTPDETAEIDSLLESLVSIHASMMGIAEKMIPNLLSPPAPARDETVAAMENVVTFSRPEVQVSLRPPAPVGPAQGLLPLGEPEQPRAAQKPKVVARASEPAPANRAKAPVLPVIVREAPRTPAAAKKAKARVKARSKAKAKKPIAELFNLAPTARGPEEKKEARRRRSDLRAADQAAQNKLPRRLARIEDAVRYETIICLEDGKSVPDLRKHLATLGMTPEQYIAKWGLSRLYPMIAPKLAQTRSVQYEYHYPTKRLIKV